MNKVNEKKLEKIYKQLDKVADELSKLSESSEYSRHEQDRYRSAGHVARTLRNALDMGRSYGVEGRAQEFDYSNRRFPPQDPKLTKLEKKVLELLGKTRTFTYVGRKTEAEFDLEIEGKMKTETMMNYSADLKLACIRDLVHWTSMGVSIMCDYQSMARSGDWSAIRDSSSEAIDRIFRKYVLAAYLIKV